ncbi:hypothetical protein NL108_000975 [Boleophthalmus pectinirostris]|nr:hypothetical protein NL108_000975 [Boleophthalmus pectinirostris]
MKVLGSTLCVEVACFFPCLGHLGFVINSRMFLVLKRRERIRASHINYLRRVRWMRRPKNIEKNPAHRLTCKLRDLLDLLEQTVQHLGLRSPKRCMVCPNNSRFASKTVCRIFLSVLKRQNKT